MELQLNSSTEPLLFMMVDSTNHISGKTGLAPTVTISKNGGAFVSPAGAVSEVGNGLYKIAPNPTDTNTLGPLWIHATATGADPTDDRSYRVVSYNPYSVATPATVWDEPLGGHLVAGTTGAKLNQSGTSSGTGSIPYVYTLSYGGSPIVGVDINVTTDVTGTNVVASGTSDINGKFVAFLNAGTYYYWRQKPGWNFANPDVEVVS